MVFLFLPAVTVLTVAHFMTTLVVFGYESTWSPIWTNREAVIVIITWISSKILIVMSIWTLSLVVLFVEGAPLRFVVEHEEV